MNPGGRRAGARPWNAALTGARARPETWHNAARSPFRATPMLYPVLFGIDALAALAAVVFLMIGLVDGSITSFNLSLWLGILAPVAAVLGGAYALRAYPFS